MSVIKKATPKAGGVVLRALSEWRAEAGRKKIRSYQ